MKFDEIEHYSKILSAVALSRVNEEGWTLLITYWEDDTYRLEYRHGVGQILHRFLLSPHINKDKVTYLIQTLSEYYDDSIDLKATSKKREIINIQSVIS